MCRSGPWRSRWPARLPIPWRVALLLAVATGGMPGPAVAQSPSTDSQSSGVVEGRSTFAPSLTLLGSLSSNPLRLVGDPRESGFVAVSADLPFQFRGPRWSADFSYTPGHQRYNDSQVTGSFEQSGSIGIVGRLSPRTRLVLNGDSYISSELRGLDATEIVVPRSRQARADVDAALVHQLTPRDSLSLTARYRRVRFPDHSDGELSTAKQPFSGSDDYSLSASYGRGVTERVSLFAGASASLGRFDSGSKARTVSVSTGLDYRVGLHTRLRLQGGALWLQELQSTADAGFAEAVGSPGYVASARLSHTVDRVSLGLSAERDVGFTTGLGRTTIRDRATASIGTQTSRWSLIGHFGFARNHPLSSAGASPGFSSSDAISAAKGSLPRRSFKATTIVWASRSSRIALRSWSRPSAGASIRTGTGNGSTRESVSRARAWLDAPSKCECWAMVLGAVLVSAEASSSTGT